MNLVLFLITTDRRFEKICYEATQGTFSNDLLPLTLLSCPLFVLVLILKGMSQGPGRDCKFIPELSDIHEQVNYDCPESASASRFSALFLAAWVPRRRFWGNGLWLSDHGI